MQNVPKIVRERLKAAAPAANHPDADALTAFAERSLPERERDVVLEHLARCGDCRDIVALALPATESVATTLRPAPREWLAWPSLRWGVVAAGVVAIVSLGIVQYQRRPQTMASKSPARVEVAANEPKDQSLAPPVSSGATTATLDNLEGRPATAIGAPAATFPEKKSGTRGEAARVPVPQSQIDADRGATPAVGGPLSHGPRLANQQQNAFQNQASAPASPSPFEKQQAAGDLSANMQVPASSEMVAVQSVAVQPDSQAKNLDASQIPGQPPVPQPSSEDYALTRVGKAKPAVTTQTANGVASGVTGGQLLVSSTPVPRWTINSNGSLQRSFDQGATWQLVDVNPNPASLDATSIQISEKASRAKNKESSSALKRDPASPVFRAVAANGTDVWAGGSSGVLYHSLDAGNHWTRVLPAFDGTTLTGDIVSLEFADMQHGRVSTSSAETWITGDGGQTWQKQ
jgi:hypothetical protein